MIDDSVYNNACWAYASGGAVDLATVNMLELAFFADMQFNLCVSQETFVEVYLQMCQPFLHANCRGQCRAHFGHYPNIHPARSSILLDKSATKPPRSTDDEKPPT